MISRPFLLITLLLRNSLLAVFLIGVFCAETQAAPFSNNTRLALSFMDFSYKEFDDDDELLNREAGLLPGLTISMDAPASRWPLTTELSLYARDVLYDGQTQPPFSIPVESRTDEFIVDFSLKLTHLFNGKSLLPEQLYYGVGYRYWRRDIRDTKTAMGVPVSGLLELYKIPYVLLGSRWDLARSNNIGWTLDLRLTHTFLSEMTVELFEGTTLDLGERFGGRASITVDYLSPNGRNFYVEPFYEYWQFGKSDIANNSGLGPILEPRSTTNNLGINIGMLW
jgi:hypothetical protein